MIGLFLGAAATALAIVIVGSLLRAPLPPVTRQVVVALVAVVLIVREFGLITFPIPQNARLVSQFVTRVPFWGALQFGAEMGTGMRTFSPTGLPHVIVAAILLLAAWPAALLAGVGFALGRALMVVSFVLAQRQGRRRRGLRGGHTPPAGALRCADASTDRAGGDDVILVVRYVLGALLLLAAVGKLRSFPAFRQSLSAYGLRGVGTATAATVALRGRGGRAGRARVGARARDVLCGRCARRRARAGVHRRADLRAGDGSTRLMPLLRDAFGRAGLGSHLRKGGAGAGVRVGPGGVRRSRGRRRHGIRLLGDGDRVGRRRRAVGGRRTAPIRFGTGVGHRLNTRGVRRRLVHFVLR